MTTTPLEPSSPSASAGYKTITACRVCGSANLVSLFSLGDQYVSDFVPPGEETYRLCRRCNGSGTLTNPDNNWDEAECSECLGKSRLPRPKVPIELVLCRECTLVQQKHTAPQDFLYTRHYWYRSGTTATMRAALRDVAFAANQAVGGLIAGDVVLDIGSNDGTLLRCYKEFAPGVVTVGVEPADNLATPENYPGCNLIKDFWPTPKYKEWFLDTKVVRDGRPKVVTALGMFYDLDDPNAFIANVAKVLAPDGVFVAQLMCLHDMLVTNDVGNLCHEHLEFYTFKSLEILFGRYGLEVFYLEENDVNGRSTRLYVQHKDGPHRAPDPNVDAVGRRQRLEVRLGDPTYYAEWFRELEDGRNRVVGFIRREFGLGKRVWVYGGSTKGNVILQWLDRSPETDGFMPPVPPSKLICYVADRSPEKWGKITVGTGIPIRSEEDFRAAKPDFALVMPYAFLPEFIDRERDWLAAGGKFIVPLPEPRLVFVKPDGSVGEERIDES